MKKKLLVLLGVGLISAMTLTASADFIEVNISGQNGWLDRADTWSAGPGGQAIKVTNAINNGGNASLLLTDGTLGNPGYYPSAEFANSSTAITTIQWDLYVPEHRNGALGLGTNVETPGGIYGDIYLSNGSSGIPIWFGGGGSGSVKPGWNHVVFVVDPDNHTFDPNVAFTMYVDGVSGGAADTQLGPYHTDSILFQIDGGFNGSAPDGPLYLDNAMVTVGGTVDEHGVVTGGSVVWSDNFDSYIIPEPASLSLLGLFGGAFLLRRRLRRRNK